MTIDVTCVNVKYRNNFTFSWKLHYSDLNESLLCINVWVINNIFLLTFNANCNFAIRE